MTDQLETTTPAVIPGTDVTPWNLLHDGYITGVERVDSTVSLRVSIDYLRERFFEPGKEFRIDLIGCSLMEYAPHDGTATDDPATISRLEPEILSAEEHDGVITVLGTEGLLRLRYEGLALRFDSGLPLALEDLDAVAVAYWDEFAARGPRPFRTAPYLAQTARWPKTGRHILAQFDADTVVVYQAYAPPIGRFAAENGWFGGPFSYNRMSWIKPNFLWMMFRCGWGTKPDQQVVLAVHLARKGFDAILAEAVHSTFVPGAYESQAQWTARVKGSQVRLQGVPDHDPHGAKLERRAIQLGLRGDFLRRYGKEWIVRIDDISALVAEQHEHVRAGRLNQLVMPEEHVYPVADREVAARLGVDEWDASSGRG